MHFQGAWQNPFPGDKGDPRREENRKPFSGTDLDEAWESNSKFHFQSRYVFWFPAHNQFQHKSSLCARLGSYCVGPVHSLLSPLTGLPMGHCPSEYLGEAFEEPLSPAEPGQAFLTFHYLKAHFHYHLVAHSPLTLQGTQLYLSIGLLPELKSKWFFIWAIFFHDSPFLRGRESSCNASPFWVSLLINSK